jgi:hypothetical protein
LFNSHGLAATANTGTGLVRTAVEKAALPLASATVGVAGGIVLGRTALQRKRKALGVAVPTPGRKLDFRGLGHQVGEAGQQLAKLAQEVRAVREKAEQIGRVIS